MCFFFFKQKTAYEMRISDWSSDVCSSDLQHHEIVDNIAAVGLKRPITVSRRAAANSVRYDLVCGEGRLEAFRMLGEAEIPAVVIDADEADCLVMSLIENIEIGRAHV